MLKPQLIIALLPHLNKDAAHYVQEQMLQSKPLADIMDFINRQLSRKQKATILNRLSSIYPELDKVFDKEVRYLQLDDYRASVKNEMEYVEYLHKLPPEEQEYVRQFYHEYYSNGAYDIPESERIMKDENQVKDATRINNSLRRDMLNNKVDQVEIAYPEPSYEQEPSEDDWEHAYKISGYEAAIDCIMDIAVAELENSLIDKKTVLMRFFIRTDRLRRLNNRDIGRTASFERSRRTKEKRQK